MTNDRWCDNGCRCHHGGVLTCGDRYNPGESWLSEVWMCTSQDFLTYKFYNSALFTAHNYSMSTCWIYKQKPPFGRTDNIQGQISGFQSQMEVIVSIIVRIFFATCAVLIIGEYFQIFPSFRWGIFGHVMH